MDAISIKEIGMTIYRFWNDYKLITKIDDVSDSLEAIKRQNSAIASFLDILKGEISDIGHIPYKSAFQNLRYAHTANETLKTGYLVAARSKFIDACIIEVNEDLLLSHLGLALCQKLLGDEMNSSSSISEAYAIKYSPVKSITASEKKAVFDVLFNSLPLVMGASVVGVFYKPEKWWVDEYNKLRKTQFERFKFTIFRKLKDD